MLKKRILNIKSIDGSLQCDQFSPRTYLGQQKVLNNDVIYYNPAHRRKSIFSQAHYT